MKKNNLKNLREILLARKLYIIGRTAARKANYDQGYDRLWVDLPESSKVGYRAIAAFVKSL